MFAHKHQFKASLLKAFCLSVSTFLVGCGADSSSPTKTTEVSDFKLESSIAPNDLFVTEGGTGQSSPSNDLQLSSVDFQNSLKLDPIAAQRCVFPTEEKFSEVADLLGGFTQPYRIPMARDESLAHYYSGHINSGLEYTDSADGDGAVTIERGDLIGRNGDTAFYLAKPHGLMAVTVDSANSDQSDVSCIFTLPGQPVNFYTEDNKIFLVLNPKGQFKNSAIMVLTWQNNQFEFESAVLLPKATVKDSRRFNNTLVLKGSYFVDYENDMPTDNHSNGNESISSETAGANADSMVDSLSSDILPPHYMESLEHLTAVNLENLNLISQEIFEADDDSYFNQFVSASDEYLVLSRSYREQIGTELGSYRSCSVYSEPRTYESCSTKWKKVPNPDYIAPTLEGGVVSCGNDLIACLRQRGPALSRFIYERDGVSCYTYSSRSCLSYETRTYEYPVYEQNTAFRIYRYVDGDFIRLDEALSIIEDNGLKLTDESVHVKGRIQDHRYLQFKDGFFYALSSEGELTTFTIQGNSVIQTNKLTNLGTNHSIGSVLFSDDKILLGQEGGFQTLSIENPIMPQLAEFISAPGQLSQLIFDDNYILGFGSILLDVGGGIKNRIEKISLFSLFDSAIELDNYLVGTDYSNSSSPADYDDQKYHYDDNYNRLFLPLTSYGNIPYVGSTYKNRVAIADRVESVLTQPSVLDMPESIGRTLSMDENNAVAFSQNYVFQLRNDQQWSKNQLQKLNDPIKVYPVPESDYWLTYQNIENGYEVRSNIQSELFKLPSQDRIEIDRAGSRVCVPDSLHFAGNMVLQISEKHGLFMDYHDCPAYDVTLPVEAVNLVGWNVSSEGEFSVANQEELTAMYLKISEVKDLYCVYDTDDFKGEKLLVADVQGVNDQFVCMDGIDFYNAR